MAYGNDSTNESQKHYKGKEERRKLIRAVLLYFFGLILDLYFVWPKSHIWAGVFFAIALAIHLLTSSRSLRKRLTFLVVLVAFTAVFIYLVPPNETSTRGFLIPANDPSPEGPCNNASFPGSSFAYFGGNEAVISPGVETTIVAIGGHNLLSLTVTSDRLVIAGDIYSSGGELAHIVNNAFTVNPNTTFRNERPDRHTLIIRDNMGSEDFRIRFLNPHAVTFTGRFFFRRRPPVIITNQEVTVGRGFPMTANCVVEPLKMIVVQ